MSIETIRLSEKERKQLITLKRRTGIENWNTLCRWALCLSLAEPSRPPIEAIPSDSSVEMSWKVFGGSQADVYLAILRQRARNEEIDLSNSGELPYIRIHINRGLSYLCNTSGTSNILTLCELPQKT